MASTYEEKELVDNIGGSGIAADYSGYAVRASKDENGNNIMSTYATKEAVDGKANKLVPASANNLAALDTNGQLAEVALTVVNNSITAIGGKTITGTESVFLAVYNSTRGDAITAALNNNKIVISVFSDGYYNHFGFMTYSDRNNHKYGFTCIEKTSNQMEQAPGNIQFDGWFCNGAGSSWYGQHNKMVLPAPGSSDVGKVLRAYQMPNSNNYNYRLETLNLVPSSTTTDSGKMLGVDSSGNAGWLTFENLGLMKARTNLVAGPRVTYLDINVSPSSGIFAYQTNNGVQYTYYGVPYTPNTTTDGQVLMYNSNSGPYWGTVPGLPTSAVGDAGKVLTVNNSGTAEWLLPNSMIGATASTAGASGVVPAPAAGDNGKFLKGDGTWDTPTFDKNYSFIWGDSPSEVYGMFQVSVGRNQYGYSGAPRKLTQVGRAGELGYLLPEPVEGTIPVSVKDDGNNKCYALKTPAQLGLLSASNPTASDADKVLTVNAQGTPVWTAMSKSAWGTVLTDGSDPLADANGNLIFDENEVDLWTTFNGTGFGAERAAADVEGNPIVDTYAKKSEVPDVSRFQQKLITDTVTATPSVNVDNNTVTSITINAGDNISAMTINCNISEGDCPNLAVEIDNQSSTDCTITVIKNNVAGSLKQSAVTDGVVKGGKFYQLTCVGRCWTMAEFN